MLSATISLTVPDLSDNDVAFANNEAWVNYWSEIEVVAEFDPVDNTIYVDNPYNNALAYTAINVDGIDYVLSSKAQFDSFLLDYSTLKANYKTLRNELKNAGFLLNSQ